MDYNPADSVSAILSQIDVGSARSLFWWAAIDMIALPAAGSRLSTQGHVIDLNIGALPRLRDDLTDKRAAAFATQSLGSELLEPWPFA